MREEKHSHRCSDRKCGTLWEHDRHVAELLDDNEPAHKCPNCGKVQRWVYEFADQRGYEQPPAEFCDYYGKDDELSDEDREDIERAKEYCRKPFASRLCGVIIEL